MKNATSPRPISENQAIATPWEFIHAVEQRFGRIVLDLAALPENTRCPNFITPELDSLKQPWPNPGFVYDGLPRSEAWNWLNPPFADIAPWAKKASEHQGVLMLVPASVGSNWFGSYVAGKASQVLFLSPRLKFTKDPYPKDLMLCVYQWIGGEKPEQTYFSQWRWK